MSAILRCIPNTITFLSYTRTGGACTAFEWFSFECIIVITWCCTGTSPCCTGVKVCNGGRTLVWNIFMLFIVHWFMFCRWIVANNEMSLGYIHFKKYWTHSFILYKLSCQFQAKNLLLCIGKLTTFTKTAREDNVISGFDSSRTPTICIYIFLLLTVHYYLCYWENKK